MGRKTVYNDGLTSEQDWAVVNEENKRLLKEFIRYCTANDKSPKTCAQYEAQLKIFFCWNLKENKKSFYIIFRYCSFLYPNSNFYILYFEIS